MKTIDDVIVLAVNECRMAPIISMIFIGGSSMVILLVTLLFLVPLSKKMTETATILFQFEVNSFHQEIPDF